MPPPFVAIGSKARRDPLGSESLNLLRRNIITTDSLLGIEHDYDGQHNALEIARTQGIVDYSAGYSLNFFNGHAVSVSSSATGVVSVTLAAGKFDAASMMAMASSASLDGDDKPSRCNVEVVSDTSLKVYLYELSGTVPAPGPFPVPVGNTWAAADFPFDLSVFAAPYARTGPLIPDLHEWLRGQSLRSERWNPYTLALAQQQHSIRQEHDASGSHDARHIAKDTTHVVWNGSGYDIDNTSGLFDSATVVNTGMVQINLNSTLTAEAYSVYSDADYARQTGGLVSDINHCNSPLDERDTNDFMIYLYRYNYTSNTWVFADFDFFVSVHHD